MLWKHHHEKESVSPNTPFCREVVKRSLNILRAAVKHLSLIYIASMLFSVTAFDTRATLINTCQVDWNRLRCINDRRDVPTRGVSRLSEGDQPNESFSDPDIPARTRSKHRERP